MKANEMPKKIYLFDYNDAMVTPLEGDTMYVREDAFVEKACDYINCHLALLDTENNDCMPEWLEKFKEAMKGE